MSWLSKATGIHLGNIGAPVGALLGSVVPGVGTALGAGLGQALGGIGSGKGVGQSVAQGLGAYAGTKGLQSVLGQGGQSSGGGSGGGSGGMSLGGLANAGLGAAQLANAANLQKQSTNYATGALNNVQQSYDQRAPLRTQGLAQMQNPTAGIDLSSLRKIAGHNSFAA